jgi:hypothetical protein
MSALDLELEYVYNIMSNPLEEALIEDDGVNNDVPAVFGEDGPVSENAVHSRPSVVGTEENKQKLNNLLLNYPYLFSDSLPETPALIAPMRITIKEGAEATGLARRVHPYKLHPIIKKAVKELYDAGVVRDSYSAISNPIVMAPKKGDVKGEPSRLCVDFSQINSVTVGMKNPLPIIATLLQRLSGMKYFATLDLTSGYHQIELHEEDRHLTATMSPDGLFEFIRVPMGLTNAPSYFQSCMNKMMHDLIGVVCEVYMDDIIVYGETMDEFLENLKRVFDRLVKYNVVLKGKKCILGGAELDWLGYTVGGASFKVQENKKSPICDFPQPKTVKQLRRFNGMCNFFRSFIKDFSTTMHPLYLLTHKGTNKAGVLNWDRIPGAVDTFVKVKDMISNSASLYHIDYNYPVHLFVDASHYGIGGVLYQHVKEELRVINFISKVFDATQAKWPAIEQEAYAIFHGITSCKTVLYGQHFFLHTDHANLTYILKHESAKLQRWRLLLQEYNFSVIHVPGKDNVVADTISRCFESNEITMSAMDIEVTDDACVYEAAQVASLCDMKGLTIEYSRIEIQDHIEYVHNIAENSSVERPADRPRNIHEFDGPAVLYMDDKSDNPPY